MKPRQPLLMEGACLSEKSNNKRMELKDSCPLIAADFFMRQNSVVKTMFYSIIYHPVLRRYFKFPCAEHSDEPQKAEISL